MVSHWFALLSQHRADIWAVSLHRGRTHRKAEPVLLPSLVQCRGSLRRKKADGVHPNSSDSSITEEMINWPGHQIVNWYWIAIHHPKGLCQTVPFHIKSWNAWAIALTFTTVIHFLLLRIKQPHFFYEQKYKGCKLRHCLFHYYPGSTFNWVYFW